MATLKEVQTKIGSVKKTKQITKAMNMVATSRLRGAQQNMDGFRPYARSLKKFWEALLKKPVRKQVLCWSPKRKLKTFILSCVRRTGGCAEVLI